jgi:putative transposase
MPRHRRLLQEGFCYHVTVRCNNREFRLTRLECREVLLFAMRRCQEKFEFKLYGLCVMSNHVHYLLEPRVPEELPQIMHWLNWYTAMCFNRMLNRTGHFWEKRYHSSGFPGDDHRRVLNTLRYIHANPKAAGMQRGFFYDFSNYGVYERLGQDGISQWHPAFLALGKTLEACAAAYKRFCERYRPKPKPERKSHWGSKLLENLKVKRKPEKKVSPGQQSLWETWKRPEDEIRKVAKTFVLANAFKPEFSQLQFE